MVTTKVSAPQNQNDDHHYIDSADLPPLPTLRRSTFEQADNPWTDTQTQNDDHSRALPNILQTGTTRPQKRNNYRISQLPDVLKPGWPAEHTPSSSPAVQDSPQRSPEREEKDWWDEDDEEETSTGVPTQSEEQKHSTLHVVNTPALSPIRRKPISPARSPGDGFLPSNNPYRRPSAGQLSPPSSQNVWAAEEQGREPTDHPNPLRSHPSRDNFGALRLEDPQQQFSPPPAFAPPPPPPSSAPPPVPGLPPPLVPQQTGLSTNPWDTEQAAPTATSPIPFTPAQQHQSVPTDTLLDRGQNRIRGGSVSLASELTAIPNAAPPTISVENPTCSALDNRSDLRRKHDSSMLPEVVPQPPTLPPLPPMPKLEALTAPLAPQQRLRDLSPRPVAESPPLLHDDDEGPRPPLPIRRETQPVYTAPSSPPPPIKPPRPAVITSPADIARMAEQRNETYQVKHFSWFDQRSRKLRRSSMLTQNQNGPCPLLALVNAMILGATDEMQATLDDALRLREQITLGLIIETLMDELLNRSTLADGSALPDVDDLNMFLIRLRTGMNANPRFVTSHKSVPNLLDEDPQHQHLPQTQTGTFETTPDLKLYSSFGVQLLHGWLPQTNTETSRAFTRTAQTYEDAQAILFGEEELEYKLSTTSLTEQEHQVWQDITSIKNFLQQNPTQLTPYGLETIQTTLRAGEFAILFRNDHFSTIYKHPGTCKIYTLITDAGYAERDEIIWESLEDISGASNEFFSGDFQSVSHDTSYDTHYEHPMPHSATSPANPGRDTSSNNTLSPPSHSSQPLSPQEQQAQSDADFAMALQLQEEEEQRQRRERVQRQNSGFNPSPNSSTTNLRPQNADRDRARGRGRRSSGNIPIALRGRNTSFEENRPTIPPRRNVAVSRPADTNDPDAPPAYEEATNSPAYNPPLGSPLHPHSSPDLAARASTSTSSVNAYGQSTGYSGRGGSTGGYLNPGAAVMANRGRLSRENEPRFNAGRRRASAYGENVQTYHGSTEDFTDNGMINANMRNNRREGRIGEERERDCVIM